MRPGMVRAFLGAMCAGLAIGQVKVESGQDPLRSEIAWARLSVPAQQLYLRQGIVVTPTLEIECIQESKKKVRRSWTLLLKLGLLQPPEQMLVLEIKLDDGKPEGYGWSIEEDNETLKYNGWRPALRSGRFEKKDKFLKELFRAKTMYVKFQPHGWRDTSVATFDVSDLQAEFAKRSECEVK